MLISEQDKGLKKVIGVRSLAANAVNLTVGSGIFALPAVVAAYLGPTSFLAYIICVVLIIMVLLCFIEAGSKIPITGGVYVYIETAFGPLAGFLANILFSMGYCIMEGDVIAAACTAALVCSKGIEMNIITHPQFRKKGLATIVAASMITDCLEKGLEPHWDAANDISKTLALKLGYKEAGSYDIVVYK